MHSDTTHTLTCMRNYSLGCLRTVDISTLNVCSFSHCETMSHFFSFQLCFQSNRWKNRPIGSLPEELLLSLCCSDFSLLSASKENRLRLDRQDLASTTCSIHPLLPRVCPCSSPLCHPRFVEEPRQISEECLCCNSSVSAAASFLVEHCCLHFCPVRFSSPSRLIYHLLSPPFLAALNIPV